jgi:hypothetical protein
MKNILGRLFSTLVLSVVVLVLMGASAPIATSVTSSATPSVISKATGSVSGKTVNGIASSMTTSVVTKRAAPSAPLSPYAEELAKLIKFDRKVLVIVKETTKERIRRLVGYDEEGYQIVASGIAVPVPQDKTDRLLSTLRKKLLPLMYTPFIVERNPGLKIDKIGVIKGLDQYEILRIMHTDGEENDIATQDVIDRLKEWEDIASFDIVGADSDWVELEFKTLPKDLKSFAQDVDDFSPAAVESGPGTIEKLAKEIKRTRRLRLLWE